MRDNAFEMFKRRKTFLQFLKIFLQCLHFQQEKLRLMKVIGKLRADVEIVSEKKPFETSSDSCSHAAEDQSRALHSGPRDMWNLTKRKIKRSAHAWH